jgi:hypothetical protein
MFYENESLTFLKEMCFNIIFYLTPWTRFLVQQSRPDPVPTFSTLVPRPRGFPVWLKYLVALQYEISVSRPCEMFEK